MTQQEMAKIQDNLDNLCHVPSKKNIIVYHLSFSTYIYTNIVIYYLINLQTLSIWHISKAKPAQKNRYPLVNDHIAGWNIPYFQIGNTSSIRVPFFHCYVRNSRSRKVPFQSGKLTSSPSAWDHPATPRRYHARYDGPTWRETRNLNTYRDPNFMLVGDWNPPIGGDGHPTSHLFFGNP